MYFLRLIRFKNLLIIALTLYFIHFFYILKLKNSLDIAIPITSIDLFLFVLAIMLIAGAGNIINDIFDIKIDTINKPNKQILTKYISVKNASVFYVIFNVLSLVIGIYLSFKYNKILLLLFFIASMLLLFVYSKTLKGRFLIGNLLVSLLTSIIIILIVWFELPENSFKSHHHSLIYFVAFFAFLLNLMREIVKDIQDYSGDLKNNLNTLPIKIGRKNSLIVTKILAFVTLVLLLFSSFRFFNARFYVAAVLLIIMSLLLVYFLVKTTLNHTKSAQKLLKTIMLIGILTIPFITLKI